MLEATPALRLKLAELMVAAPSVKVRVKPPTVPVSVRPLKVATPEPLVTAVAEESEPEPECTVAVTVSPLTRFPPTSLTVTTG